MSRSKLIIFNLETDLDSQVLASGVSWIEELSKSFEEVQVFSTHVGRYKLPENVTVSEIGGGSFLARLGAIRVLLKAALVVRRSPSKWTVFHHMSSRTCFLLGSYFKAMRVRQVLWYSHNHASLDLIFGYRFMDVIVTPTQTSFPLKSTKIKVTGHAIRVPRADLESHSRYRSGIVSLGRITRVKNLDLLSSTLKDLQDDELSKIRLVALAGPVGEDKSYSQELLREFSKLPIEFNYMGSLSHINALKMLNDYSIYFTGTPKSVDKATIEAAMLGCLIVSETIEALELTGMIDVWRLCGYAAPPPLILQISTLLSLPDKKIKEFRILITKVSTEKNGIEKTIGTIVQSLIE
jgi:glycosyltransferase involved in cell wall biosynthesis